MDISAISVTFRNSEVDYKTVMSGQFFHSCKVFSKHEYSILVYWIDSVGGFRDNICNISVMVVIHRREGG